MEVCLEVPDFSINCFVNLIIFHFSHASMIIKVSNKVIDSLNRIYLNEFFILLFIYLVSETCEAGYLGIVLGTASIVVRVESFESVYQDNWLDS